MEDPDDIDVEIVEPEEIEQNEEMEPKTKGVGLVSVVIFSAFAALTGAVGGAFGAQYFIKAPDISAINSQISLQAADVEDKFQKSVNALKVDMNALKTDLMDVQGGQASEQILASLQNRLEVLENAPETGIPEIEPEALTALQNAQADGFEWPDMTGLESTIVRLEQENSDLSDRVQALSDALESITDAPTDIMPIGGGESSRPLTINQTITLPAFPETALRKAADEAVKQKGFLARTLSKHIDVRQPDDPVVLIEKSALAVKSGDLELAVKTFDQLPDEIKAAGQDWRSDAGKLE